MAKLRAQERAQSTAGSNTFKKVFPFLGLAIIIAIVGTTYPDIIPADITKAAIGAVTLGLSVLAARFLQTPEVPPKDTPPKDPR